MATLLQEIIGILKKKDNQWLDYNEIYDLMNKSLFGPNKHGERGKRNIVYRLIVGNPLFEIDDNFRPKKFRLKQHVFKEKDVAEVETVYSTSETRIFTKDNNYEEVLFTEEDDFENEIRDNYKLIFGQDAIYYDVKRKIGNRICDGIVFNPKNKKVYIVEAELFIHDLYGHIVPQIIDFFNGMKDEKTKQSLKYEIEWKKDDQLEIIKAIDKESYDIVVVIDRITFKIEDVQKNISELIKHFVKNKDVNIIFREFNVFIDKDKGRIFRVK